LHSFKGVFRYGSPDSCPVATELLRRWEWLQDICY